MKVVGPQQAATGEPTGASVPSGAEHEVVCCKHTEKTLILLDPEFETNKLLAPAFGQVVVGELVPAQREMATPVGLLPTGYGDPPIAPTKLKFPLPSIKYS